MANKVTPRERQMLYLRKFDGWEKLRSDVAHALGLPEAEVRGLKDDADPAVRIDAHVHVIGFQVTVDLYVDPARTRILPLDELGPRLARTSGIDVAYARRGDPYTYVIVRSSGERVLAEEQADDDADGLLLDESPERLRHLS
jgi:hypothetical protein